MSLPNRATALYKHFTGPTNLRRSYTQATAPSEPPIVHKPHAVPFFRDPAHTIPTKWSLYRPLLLALAGRPDPSHVKREIRQRWREMCGMTSVPRVRAFLEEYHDLLDHLISPKPEHQEAVSRLEAKLRLKHNRADEQARAQLEAQAAKSPARPPRLTGSFHRPTLFNPPLPRMKPQPIGISMMIHNRLRAREARMVKRKVYASLVTDMKLEVGFWKGLERERGRGSAQESEVTANGERERERGRERDAWTSNRGSDSPGGWDEPIQREIRIMDARFKKENRRAEMVYSRPMMGRVERAKKRRQTRRVGHEDKERASAATDPAV
ncbi:hypothetical protein IAU60_002778 [Kwoniella sp. DSM 27419]